MYRLAFAVVFLYVAHVEGIPIDNGVVGVPEVECGRDQIAVYFQTREPFTGRVFTKGFSNVTACVRGYEPGTQLPLSGTTIILSDSSLRACGSRTTVLPVEEGDDAYMVELTVVISFHVRFITKVDRVYRIECTYRRSGERTVTQPLDVSMLTTQHLRFAPTLPTCSYQVLNNEPEDPRRGEPVRYATVGQKVLHQWKCDGDSDAYCMRVHSCFVDSVDRSQELLDINGCPIDNYLLQVPLKIPGSLTFEVETHVFKFADLPSLFFRCRIGLTEKEPNTDCAERNCRGRELAKYFRNRNKRQISQNDGENDVPVSNELSVLELLPEGYDDLKEKTLPFVPLVHPETRVNYCVDGLYRSLFVLALTAATVLLFGFLFATFLYLRNKQIMQSKIYN